MVMVFANDVWQQLTGLQQKYELGVSDLVLKIKPF